MANRKKKIDPRVSALLAAFGAEVKTVISLAGKGVTFRWLEETAHQQRGVPLPKASLYRLLNGVNEPDWRMVEQVLRLCAVPQQEIEGVWRPRWAELITRIRAVELTEQITPALVAGSTECAVCGAAVLNEARHQEYHAEMEALGRRRALRVAG